MRSPASAGVAAQELIAEIGVDMTVFPTAAPPGVLGQVRPDRPQLRRPARRAAPPARATPGWPAPSARSSPALARTDTFLGDRYRRLARRRGKKRAIVAVGNSVLTIVWHLLSDPDAHYHDLGPDYYESRRSTTSAANATSSANSNTSPARKSPSNPRPEPTRRVTPHDRTPNHPNPAPLRSAGRCRLPTHHRFSSQDTRLTEVGPRLIEVGPSSTWRRINTELGRLHPVTLAGPAGRMEQAAHHPHLRPSQLFDATGVAPPPRVTSLQPA